MFGMGQVMCKMSFENDASKCTTKSEENKGQKFHKRKPALYSVEEAEAGIR